jgi:hypothetical protein
VDHPIDRARARLGELQQEYATGQGQLQELARQEAALRETMLRISGAIQVLEELLAAGAQPAGPEPPGTLGHEGASEEPRTQPQVLTVP